MTSVAPPSSAPASSPPQPIVAKKPRQWAYRYRRIVLLLVLLVIVPSVLLSAVGVVLLVSGEKSFNLLLGILVLCFTGAVVTGVVLAWVFIRRDAQLSQLQADFVSKVSHELRTPLTSIRMFTDTLAMRRGNPEVETKCIEALTRESMRLQDLIDRLLDWGRMESGRRLYEKRSIDVAQIIHDAATAVEPGLTRNNAKLELSIADDLPPLVCDKGAMRDAVINLLSNAYKYGGNPPHIAVTARRDGHFVRIAVKDDGQGIERREHRRIFEKFYRIDDRLSREREGSGLGLAIVDHVMRGHGGHVELDSAPGRGSTFTLVVPVAA